MKCTGEKIYMAPKVSSKNFKWSITLFQIIRATEIYLIALEKNWHLNASWTTLRAVQIFNSRVFHLEAESIRVTHILDRKVSENGTQNRISSSFVNRHLDSKLYQVSDS